jgi:recombination endonuclease VII
MLAGQPAKSCKHKILPKGDCEICRKEYQDNYRKSITSSTYRRYRLKYRFNLTVEDVIRMLKKQKNRCKLCRRVFGVFVIDHDHGCCPTPRNGNRKSCGKCVRGLLCTPCNAMLGQISRAIKVGLNKVWRYIR